MSITNVGGENTVPNQNPNSQSEGGGVSTPLPDGDNHAAVSKNPIAAVVFSPITIIGIAVGWIVGFSETSLSGLVIGGLTTVVTGYFVVAPDLLKVSDAAQQRRQAFIQNGILQIAVLSITIAIVATLAAQMRGGVIPIPFLQKNDGTEPVTLTALKSTIVSPQVCDATSSGDISRLRAAIERMPEDDAFQSYLSVVVAGKDGLSGSDLLSTAKVVCAAREDER